jgi:polyferredoxin
MKRRIPRRRRPGWLNRFRLGVLAVLVAAIAFHMYAWYFLGWRTIGKFSFSGLASALVGHMNMAAFFCIALVVSLFFVGRFFCGFLCKLGAFQEVTEAFFHWTGFRPKLIHTRARMVRLFMFVPYFLPVMYLWHEKGLSTSYVNLGAVEPWTGDLPVTIIGSVFYFVTITFGLTAVFGRRAFCRLVCPFALFFQLFERLPWLPRIQQTGRCIGCDVCDQVCPMGIQVENEILRQGKVTDPECIRCLICIDVCPVKALKYSTSKPLPPQQPDLPATFRESAFPVWVDGVLATMGVVGGVWAALHYTGFFVFLGASWGLMIGAAMVAIVGAVASRMDKKAKSGGDTPHSNSPGSNSPGSNSTGSNSTGSRETA